MSRPGLGGEPEPATTPLPTGSGRSQPRQAPRRTTVGKPTTYAKPTRPAPEVVPLPPEVLPLPEVVPLPPEQPPTEAIPVPSEQPPTEAIRIPAQQPPTEAIRPDPSSSEVTREPSASFPAQAGPPATERHRLRPESVRPRISRLLVPVLVGALVAIALGAYGRLHNPTGYAINVAGFSSPGYVKAWLASVAAFFGVIQLATSALVARSARRAPAWASGLHRWSGRIAVLVSVPVAMHCLYAMGYQSGSTRVWLHSIAGCLFYGVFTAKMLSLSRPGTPRWAVPLLGGVVFTLLAGLWLTSALWLFRNQGVHL
jgi:hypothetical protein